MSALEAKIVKEGEAEAKAFKEFFEWCDSASQNLNNEIKTGTTQQGKLEAKIGELTSDIDVAESKVEELSAAISANEADLNDATGVRNKEAAEFAAAEKELVETVDTLDRAISIISTEMAKNPAALAQIDRTSMSSLIQSLGAVVDAAGFSTSDHEKLIALVQGKAGDEDTGAPAAATYKSQSGGIVDVLEDLAKHNFGMMKQSLEDQVAADTKDLNDQKANK